MTSSIEMRDGDFDEALRQLRDRLRSQRPAGLSERRSGALAEHLLDCVSAEISAFSDSSNPQILPLLKRHMTDIAADTARLLGGEPMQALKFTARFAARAAEENFPLEPILRSYRVCTRELMRTLPAALAVAGKRDDVRLIDAINAFVLEYLDAVGITAAEHHIDRSRLLADVASDQRSELLSILLGGYDESDRRVSRILRDAGYLDRRLSFCVILAQSIDPAEMHNPARARRLADYIDRLLAKLPGKRLVDLHRNKVTVVFAQRPRQSGWSKPQAPLSRRLAQELLKIGTAVRIGVSNDVSSTGQLPAAYQQASLAFDLSSIGKRVVRFDEIPLLSLLQYFAGDDFTRVLPPWTEAFHAADDRARGQLARTLQVFAQENMNLLQTAKQLRIHPNTVYARFDRIAAVSGLEPRSFRDLSALLIVIASRDRPTAHWQETPAVSR
jgi:hypothetical protein